MAAPVTALWLIHELRKRAKEGLALSPEAVEAIRQADVSKAERSKQEAAEIEQHRLSEGESLALIEEGHADAWAAMQAYAVATEKIQDARERHGAAARLLRAAGLQARQPEKLSIQAHRSYDRRQQRERFRRALNADV